MRKTADLLVLDGSTVAERPVGCDDLSLEAHYAPRTLGYVALTVGPLAVFAAMAVAWSAIHSELRGGLDFGVLVLGAGVSALVTVGYCRYQQLDVRTSVRCTLRSFAFTFAVSLVVLLVLAFALGHLAPGGPDN